MIDFNDILKLSQKELFGYLKKIFGKKAICSKGNYILIPGDAPVMLIAHMDTVHKETVKQICKSRDGNIIMSPQGIGGDDRCGVFGTLCVYSTAKAKPWLLYTCDEETGGQGARVFCAHYRAGKLPKGIDKLKLLIELDRKGHNEAVYYSCDNTELETYITSKGYETDWGSYSDIATIAPELGIAAVNLSAGYYNAHTLHEYIVLSHLNDTIRTVSEIVAEAAQNKIPKYEYIEAPPKKVGKGHSWGVHRYYASLYDNLNHIPLEIRDEYEELLDYYTMSELDMIREDYGDCAILMMYESELGTYCRDYGDYGDTDDKKDT